MSTLNKFIMLSFALVVVYLLLRSRGSFNTIIGSIGNQATLLIRQFQGRGDTA